ncbi:vanadium-dependent haloperoxidase [Clostridium sp. D2Q-11]|uniref:Vanadium-dependent haloperoxidase n=1 Tax=Anaeromonas frigoriresistens TaxID=2683708 RepID=A0A942UYN5_9FIRM|nr:vanadium-dependent haloperoxidase [Anaeromonas frigoriresistens]MBS4538741.1 vanadium-dependent haloperoxidase [Anaeromonas frigoriresistens]
MNIDSYKNKKCSDINLSRKWSELPYAGEDTVPQGLDPNAGSWPLYFMDRNTEGEFTTLDGKVINFDILNPDYFNFNKELLIVKETLDNLTQEEKVIAEYWGDGPATKQWTPIIDRLIDTYRLTPVYAARVLAAVHAGINDAFIVAWYYKYLWDVARPNQLDQELVTEICTPKFPAYPSGHSVISGTAEVILSYFFPSEANKLRELAEENSLSRLYGGVHFPADLSEGLRLGRQIGNIIVDVLNSQYDENDNIIDKPITEEFDADLYPTNYEQVILFPSRAKACDLPLLSDSCKRESEDKNEDKDDEYSIDDFEFSI